MKHLPTVIAVSVIAGLAFCNPAKNNKGQTIIITNTSSVDLEDKPVVIHRKDLPVLAAHLFPLLTGQRGDTIPSQLDDTDGDHLWDELSFVVSLPSHQTDSLQLQWIANNIAFPRRTSVRFGVRQTVSTTVQPATSDTFYADQLPGVIGFQHYQTDGPTWENDRVGFRQYLDGRNSIDVFGKTVHEITPDSVGIGKDGKTENNYSVMKDWGTDVLAVANSAGIGGFSLMIGDSLPRLGIIEGDSLNNVDSTICTVLSEGPVRSIIKFRYINWKALDRKYTVEQTTSIWPGVYAYSNSVRFNDLKGDETMVVSLVNSNTTQALSEMDINKDWVVLYTHDKQSVDKQWWLGLALVLPKKNYLGFIEAPKKGRLSNAYLGKLHIQNNQPVSYYALAAWELSDPGFKDPAYFKRYLAGFVNQLTPALTVSIRR